MINILNKKELMEISKDEYFKVWGNNSNMIEYCTNKDILGIQFKSGLLTIEKPDIETSFCFGYGYCGMSTIEDYEDASNMAQHAKTNEQYFIDENLKDYNERISNLKECLESDFEKVVFQSKYIKTSNLINYTIANQWEIDNEPYRFNNIVSIATDEEINAIIEMLEQAKALFEKRLNAYLKRYGLSKIRSWTYLSD